MWTYGAAEHYTLSQYLVSWCVVFPVYVATFLFIAASMNSIEAFATSIALGPDYDPNRVSVGRRIWKEGFALPTAAIAVMVAQIIMFWVAMAVALDVILRVTSGETLSWISRRLRWKDVN